MIKIINILYKIKHYITFFKQYLVCEIPSPFIFETKQVRSNLDLIEIITDLDKFLPQLANFISQFNDTINQSGINVITDSAGNMSIDVPQNMPDLVSHKLSNRIGVIDRLITTRGQEINELFSKGLEIEKNIKAENPSYTSQLSEKIQEFKRLNNLYKH